MVSGHRTSVRRSPFGLLRCLAPPSLCLLQRPAIATQEVGPLAAAARLVRPCVHRLMPHELWSRYGWQYIRRTVDMSR